MSETNDLSGCESFSQNRGDPNMPNGINVLTGQPLTRIIGPIGETQGEIALRNRLRKELADVELAEAQVRAAQQEAQGGFAQRERIGRVPIEVEQTRGLTQETLERARAAERREIESGRQAARMREISEQGRLAKERQEASLAATAERAKGQQAGALERAQLGAGTGLRRAVGAVDLSDLSSSDLAGFLRTGDPAARVEVRRRILDEYDLTDAEVDDVIESGEWISLIQ